jgi:hypothetical protein
MAFSELTTVAHINEIRDPVAHKTTKNVLRNSMTPCHLTVGEHTPQKKHIS